MSGPLFSLAPVHSSIMIGNQDHQKGYMMDQANRVELLLSSAHHNDVIGMPKKRAAATLLDERESHTDYDEYPQFYGSQWCVLYILMIHSHIVVLFGDWNQLDDA